MASLPHSGTQGLYTTMRDLKWSPAEKAIARKAFHQALQRELEAVILESKQMAAKINQPSDLWDLERYLPQRREEIERKYDYRYSVLPLVFGNLVREGRLSEEELYGLAFFAALLRAAQRFFIIIEMRFRAAGLMVRRPRGCLAAGLTADLRCAAQRFR